MSLRPRSWQSCDLERRARVVEIVSCLCGQGYRAVAGRGNFWDSLTIWNVGTKDRQMVEYIVQTGAKPDYGDVRHHQRGIVWVVLRPERDLYRLHKLVQKTGEAFIYHPLGKLNDGEWLEDPFGDKVTDIKVDVNPDDPYG